MSEKIPDDVLSEADKNAVQAMADLAGRCGGRQFQIGYLHDGVPVDQMAWYAHMQFRGTRITVDGQPSPGAAARGLAERILTGARCRCGKLVALSDGGAMVYRSATLVDGTKWTRKQAARAGQCRWTLVGARWEPSCPDPDGDT